MHETSRETDSFCDKNQRKIIKVPVRMLGESEGVIAKEIVGPSGAVILPAGVDITLFEASIGMLISKMEAQGVEWVYLHAMQQLSDEEIEETLERVYSDDANLISKEKARNVIKQVDTMFHDIQDDDINPEMVLSLSNMSHDLSEELLRNPSIAFSLGKVHDADEYTFIHSFNVAVLCGYLANRIHPGDRGFLQAIVLGSLLHDMGKAQIPNEILNKPGPLTGDEFKIMQNHPNQGVVLALKSGVRDRDVINVIGAHHEKWSGKGYPNNMKGFEIPETARIAAVADVFDALTAKRVYKNAMSSRKSH